MRKRIYTDIILDRGKEVIPAKCNVCKEEIDFEYIERNMSFEQQLAYNEYALINIVKADRRVVSWKKWNYTEYWDKDDQSFLFYWRNEECK